MPEPDSSSTERTAKLIAVTLDEASIGRADPKVDHERQVAIFDILEENSFELTSGLHSGPFRLHLSLDDDRLVFQIEDEGERALAKHTMSLVPFRRILRDYFLILESYYKAVSDGQPAKIEAIDMGRRGLHDEGSQLLKERLGEEIVMDFPTARRLFTLLAALHWKA